MNAVVDLPIEEIAANSAVFYSQSVGFIYNDLDGIRNNSWLKQELAKMPKELISRKDGSTSFQMQSSQIGFFMHMMYANMPEGFILQADWDGIFPFIGQDEQGNPARFNAQLVTLRQVAESAPVPMAGSNLH